MYKDIRMTSGMLQFCIIVLLCSLRSLTSASYQDMNSLTITNYEYESGPDWRNSLCSGRHQSPINIVQSSVISNNEALVNLINYNRSISLENVSTAHRSVSFKMNPRANASLTIGRSFGNKTIRSEYDLYHFHFHWNCTEHWIDDQRYALELHFVHYNRQFGNFSNAMSVKGGLSVLAVLFKLSKRDNEALNALFDMMKPGSTGPSSNSTLKYSDLLPGKNFTVYNYNGSLTTPFCNETVDWNVISVLNTVSSRQISEFQKLHNYSVPHNCRRLQRQNRPQVHKINVTMTSTDDASTASSQFVLCAISILILIHSSKSIFQC